MSSNSQLVKNFDDMFDFLNRFGVKIDNPFASSDRRSQTEKPDAEKPKADPSAPVEVGKSDKSAS